jgi:hypothetical protein
MTDHKTLKSSVAAINERLKKDVNNIGFCSETRTMPPVNLMGAESRNSRRAGTAIRCLSSRLEESVRCTVPGIVVLKVCYAKLLSMTFLL